MKQAFLIAGALLLSFLTFQGFGQDSSPAEISDIVSKRSFVFRPQSVMPMSGSTRQLTGGFEFKMSGDTIVSYLPYFGRAYSAPPDPSKAGIDFTSTKFIYTVTERKKGGWDIVIKPEDATGVQQMTFLISESGSANLQVNSTNRQPISFNGIISRR